MLHRTGSNQWQAPLFPLGAILVSFLEPLGVRGSPVVLESPDASTMMEGDPNSFRPDFDLRQLAQAFWLKAQGLLKPRVARASCVWVAVLPCLTDVRLLEIGGRAGACTSGSTARTRASTPRSVRTGSTRSWAPTTSPGHGGRQARKEAG